MGQEIRLPQDFDEISLGMSNFDHTIDDGFEKALRENKVFGRHSGYEFNGMVWYNDKRFHEEVWRYCAYVETISADTLEELMEKVNDKWGYK